MNGKILSIILVLTIAIFVGCQEMQTEAQTDISYVPIDQINVEGETEEDQGFMETEGESEEVMTETEEPIIMMEEDEQETDEATLEEVEEIISQLEAELEEESESTVNMEETEEEETIEEIMVTEEEETTFEPKEIVIIVQETDLVNLKPVASDPDEDQLQFTYTTPLDENGEWQTTYGDMGEFTITITASDGELTTEGQALLIVNKKEEEPTIDSRLPEVLEQSIEEDTQIKFSIQASDLNKDLLEYSWTLDDEEVSKEKSYTYIADFNSAGSHVVVVEVTDGVNLVSLEWTVDVANVDRAPVLKVIPDITIKETETVVITPDAFDPDEDEIIYTISDPVGETGIWETSYNDAGIYNVKVTASDNELEDSQNVKVTVVNVNRPPVIQNIIQVQ